MKYLTTVLLALLLTSAAATDRHVPVSSEYNGHGVVIGPGLVLTVAHLMCDEDSCRNIAVVDGNPAIRKAWGKGGYSDDSADDNCDWALLDCPAYQAAAWLEYSEPAVGDECWYRRGDAAQHIRVSAYADGIAEFTGARPRPGDSGSGIYRKSDGALVGLLTSRNNGCTTCIGNSKATGWFCAIDGELAAALQEARNAGV